MIKTSIGVKENLSLLDRVTMTNIIVESYFTEDESETIYFTPYYKEMTTIMCFAKYFLEGVKFEDEEDVYETVINDKELYREYQSFTCYSEVYKEIQSDIDEIVEFRKQQVIHNKKSSLDTLFDSINEIVSSMKDNMDMDELLPIIQNLGELGKLDEKKIVNAVLGKIKSKPQDHKEKQRKPKITNPNIVVVDKVGE